MGKGFLAIATLCSILGFGEYAYGVDIPDFKTNCAIPDPAPNKLEDLNAVEYYCAKENTNYFFHNGELVLFFKRSSANIIEYAALKTNNGEWVAVRPQLPVCGPGESLETKTGCRWYSPAVAYWPPGGKKNVLILMLFDDHDQIIASRIICPAEDAECHRLVKQM